MKNETGSAAEIRAEGWPTFKHDDTTLGNLESCNAVSVLWTKREEVLAHLDPKEYCIVGQTYSPEGVSLVIRNMLANTGIRRLVVCGADLHLRSGQAFVNLWKDGLNSDHSVGGVDKTVIHPQIPFEAIDRLRERVEIHDLRGWNKARLQSDLGGFLKSLPALPPQGEPELYPMPEVVAPETMPSEKGAHLVRARTIGQGWLRAIREVSTYGTVIPTIYGGEQSKDLTNLVMVITDEDPASPKIESYLPFSEASVAKYMEEFLMAEVPEGVPYTYGERLHAFRDMGQIVFEEYRDHIQKKFGVELSEEFAFADRVFKVGDPRNINQVAIMIEKLNRTRFDRGAVAILYDPVWDNLKHAQNQEFRGFRNPCAITVQATIKEDQLNLTAEFRSHDIADAWPTNAFGLRSIQAKIAEATNSKVGPLITVSASAHVYEHSYGMVDNALKENQSALNGGFGNDPRGAFTIEVNKEGEMVVTHRDPDTGQQLGPETVMDGKRSRATEAMGIQIARQGLLSDPGHGIYLGRELHIAEVCAKLGITYRQEDPEGFQAVLQQLVDKSRKYDELMRNFRDPLR